MLSKTIRVVFFSPLLWLAMALVLVPSVTAAFKYLREGMKAPAVTGRDILSNNEISTDKLLAEKNLVIVVFWATWSERSLEELMHLKDMALQMQDLPVRIVAVNVESQSISAPVRKNIVEVAAELELPFPIIIDNELELFYKYGVVAVPSTAVLDTTGTLRYGPAGYSLTTRDLIVDSIEVLLGLKEPTVATVVAEGHRPENEASRYYNLALNLFDQRLYERALANLELATSSDPRFAAPNILRGEIYLRLDQQEEAAEQFTRAVSLDSASVAAWSGWGKTLLQQGNLADALVKISAALERDNSYTPAFLDLGLVLAEQGKIAEALDSLEKAAELNQRDPDVHFYLGRVHLLANDTAGAAISFKTALDILFPPR